MKTILLLLLMPCIAFGQAAQYESQLPERTPAPTPSPTPEVVATPTPYNAYPATSGTLSAADKVALFQQRLAAQKEAAENERKQKEEEAAEQDAERKKWTALQGGVLQNINAGLLVELTDNKVILLRGVPNKENMADGNGIDAMAEEDGVYQYTDVMNTVRTVKAYVWKINRWDYHPEKKAFGPDSQIKGGSVHSALGGGS